MIAGGGGVRDRGRWQAGGTRGPVRRITGGRRVKVGSGGRAGSGAAGGALVGGPVHGGGGGVFAESGQIVVGADDVLIVVALPKAPVKGRPAAVFDTANVCVGGNRLEPADNIAQRRGNPVWLPLRRAATRGRPYERQDAMDVVGHNDESVGFGVREFGRQRVPPVRDSFPEHRDVRRERLGPVWRSSRNRRPAPHTRRCVGGWSGDGGRSGL